MVDYKKFITALKSTWIRRILQSNAKWKKLLESELKICIDKLWIFGIDFIRKVCANSTNNFWKAIQERKALLQDFVKPPLPIIPATIAIFF